MWGYKDPALCLSWNDLRSIPALELPGTDWELRCRYMAVQLLPLPKAVSLTPAGVVPKTPPRKSPEVNLYLSLFAGHPT